MSLEILSRWQFGMTVMFHFVFVSLTIGVILPMCVFEFLHMKNGDDRYRKLCDFYGNFFAVNYAIGIVTGIGMSIQFGTNWAEYSMFMGDVFGAPLAFEALLAFFLESTFAGVYIFRRNKISPKFRFVTVLLITIGTSLSALWIITANGFMQHPVGYELSADGSKILLVSIKDLLLNPYTWYILVHTLMSLYLLGSMFVIGVSANKLRSDKINDEEKEIFKLSTKIASYIMLIVSLLLPIIGGAYTGYIGKVQPAKLNAITGVVDTVTDVPQVPSNLVPIVNVCFLIMVTLGTAFIIGAIYMIVFKKKYFESPTQQKIASKSWILAIIAILAGWGVAEMGRQPWVVYGLMKTSEGYSNVPVGQVVFSIITVMSFNLLLFIVFVYLGRKQLAKPIDAVAYEYKK